MAFKYRSFCDSHYQLLKYQHYCLEGILLFQYVHFDRQGEEQCSRPVMVMINLVKQLRIIRLLKQESLKMYEINNVCIILYVAITIHYDLPI